MGRIAFGTSSTRGSGRAAAFLVFLVLVAVGPAAAQDQALDLLLFTPPPTAADASADLEARTLQLYRLPLSLRLREMDDTRWGIRITFPLSVTSLRVRRVSDVNDFVKQLRVGSVVPGIELEIPVHEGVRLRPFAEAGFGWGTDDGRIEALYGAGASVKVDGVVGPARLTVGGAATHRNSKTSADEYGSHSVFEAGIDTQVPLGVSIGRKPAYAGGFFIARRFAGLQLERTGQDPIALEHQFEAGVSFGTRPDFQVWKLKLPWIAVGYQFGHTLSGVRIYTKFPF